MNQFWKTIVPVVGEPIPGGAEANVYGTVWTKSTVIRPGINQFSQDDAKYDWRVPVSVVPESVAVDAIMQLATRGTGEYWQLFFTRDLVEAPCREQLRDMVTAKLRQLSQESTNGTH